MKKIIILIMILLISFSLVGCKEKGEITQIKLVEVECVADNYIKFKGDNTQYQFNEAWFDDLNVAQRIIDEKISNGDILRVSFSYFSWWAEDSIKDYEIIKRRNEIAK